MTEGWPSDQTPTRVIMPWPEQIDGLLELSRRQAGVRADLLRQVVAERVDIDGNSAVIELQVIMKRTGK